MTGIPRVSVVLPVHNRQDLVHRAIDSVLAQTMPDFELLVIDDCSTDATADVVQSYCADPRVMLFRNETNLGPAGARNRGIELARARYIAFQDSDDRWFPEKLACQLRALERVPDVQACFCGALYFARENCYYIPGENRLDAESAASGDLSHAVLRNNPVTPQALMVRKALLETIGGFDTSFRINEDWELVIRMAQHTRFFFIADPLVVIYRTDNSVSSDRASDAAARSRLLDNYAALFENNPAARAAQNYIVAGQYLKVRKYREAVQHFRRSFRDVPTLRCLLQLQRARVLAMTRST